MLKPIAEKFADGTYRRDVPEEIVKGVRRARRRKLSRPQLEALEKGLKEIKGFKGLARAKVAADGSWTQSPLKKDATDDFRAAINLACATRPRATSSAFSSAPPRL